MDAGTDAVEQTADGVYKNADASPIPVAAPEASPVPVAAAEASPVPVAHAVENVVAADPIAAPAAEAVSLILYYIVIII